MPETKTSKILTWVSIVVGFLGVADLVIASRLYNGGAFLGYRGDYYFLKSIVFLLIAIWFELGAIYHKK